MTEDYERGREYERARILKLISERAKFWTEWEYPDEYLLATETLMALIKGVPTKGNKS